MNAWFDYSDCLIYLAKKPHVYVHMICVHMHLKYIEIHKTVKGIVDVTRKIPLTTSYQ